MYKKARNKLIFQQWGVTFLLNQPIFYRYNIINTLKAFADNYLPVFKFGDVFKAL